MDSRFNRIFRSLDDSYVIVDSIRDNLSIEDKLLRRNYPRELRYRGVNIALLIRDSIERVIGRLEMNSEIRPDARHFLLINFTEMVAQPLYLDPEERYSIEEVIDTVQSDIESILLQSREQKRNTSDGRPDQISGGDVLKAVANRYDSLKVARFRVWN